MADLYDVPETKPKTRAELIQEIRESDRTYYIRNNTSGRIRCEAEPPISLGPAGYGQDTATLPKEILSSTGIQRMWAQGRITITDDPSIEEEMVEGSIRARAAQEEARRKLFGGAELEEPSSNRDLVEKKCLITGDRVYQTVADIKNMVPPLVPAYKNRAHEFIPTVSLDAKGNEVVTFNRVAIEH